MNRASGWPTYVAPGPRVEVFDGPIQLPRDELRYRYKVDASIDIVGSLTITQALMTLRAVADEPAPLRGELTAWWPGTADAVTVYLTYPMGRTARVQIEPFRVRDEGAYTRTSLSYVLWQAARAYRVIYRQQRKYAVDPIPLHQLWFTRVGVTADGARAVLGVSK